MARRWVAAGSRVAPLDDLQMSEAAISPDKVTVSHAPSRGVSAKVLWNDPKCQTADVGCKWQVAKFGQKL